MLRVITPFFIDFHLFFSATMRNISKGIWTGCDERSLRWVFIVYRALREIIPTVKASNFELEFVLCNTILCTVLMTDRGMIYCTVLVVTVVEMDETMGPLLC